VPAPEALCVVVLPKVAKTLWVKELDARLIETVSAAPMAIDDADRVKDEARGIVGRAKFATLPEE
jgi:hypothetical protein